MKRSVDFWEEIYAGGTVSSALLYASLIWPEFVEVDGMVFFAEERAAQPALADPAKTLARRFGGDRSEMERAFNAVEIPKLFASAMEADVPEVARLAEILRAAWKAKLAADFPDRQFVIEVLRGEIDDPTLRFHAVR